MSRSTDKETEYTFFHSGNDHAIGCFLDITDRRFAGTENDPQGEGYLLEYSEMFGISTNLIGATLEDLKSRDRLIELVEKFIKEKVPEAKILSKIEAIEIMKNGGKVTHRYFDRHEWVRQSGFMMFMEDGASIDSDTFWSDRSGEAWETDWKIFI